MTRKEEEAIKAIKDDAMRFHLWDIADSVREVAKEVEPIRRAMLGEEKKEEESGFWCVRMVPGSFKCRMIPEEKLDEALTRMDRNGGIWFGRALVGYYSKKRVFRIQGKTYLAGPLYLARYGSASEDITEVLRDVAALGMRSTFIEIEGNKIPMYELGDGS